MQDNISKIKERIDIVDLISGYIKLQKAGVNFKACCPFHNEKTPSFYVSPERQIWHCFGCSAGGSVFDFVMQSEGVEFGEALRILARRAGVELDEFDRELQSERGQLLNICEKAAKFFEKQLAESNTGKKALAYLYGRGVSEQSVKSFRLGFAPDSWDSLFIFLKDSGYDSGQIEKAGLILKKEGGSSYYDRFRSRIMFPIFDLNNQAVGFTGRVFSAEGGSASGGEAALAKYINTPQTILYDKSRILYGLDKAKADIRKKKRALVVEGNMDVIMSHQAGVANCVASSGTALTESHIQLLKRYAENLDLCFDADSAGQLATQRGVALALKHRINVGIVAIDDPKCKDPADYVKIYGQKWQEQASNSKNLAGFYMEKALSEYEPEKIDGKKSIIAKLLPLIKSIANIVEQSHWLAELALKLKVKEEDLRSEMRTITALAEPSADGAELSPSSSKFLEFAGNDIIEDYAMSLLMRRPLWYAENHMKIRKDFFSETAKLILDKLKIQNSPRIEFANLTDGLGKGELARVEIWHLQSQAEWTDIEEYEFEKELDKILFQLKKRLVSSKLAALEGEIKEAEKTGDEEKIILLAKQFSELSREISGTI